MSKIEILAVIVSILWTFFKTAGFFEMRRLAKLERLFQALEVGVYDAWIKVVKPWLDANPTMAKLPDNIKREAREVATVSAEKADKVVKEFPTKIIDATIAAIVSESKARAGKI